MRVPWDRGGVRWYLIFLGLVIGRPSPAALLAGMPLLLLGIALHLWAKGCLHQNKEVTTAGPYRYVRHPFYLGNLLIDAAMVIMSASVLLACAFPVWWMAVYLPVIRREEAAMAGFFGDRYRTYARRVGLLFPTARPLPAGPGFSWRNNNLLRTEVPRALRFLSYPLLFALAYEWRKNGLALPSPATPLTFYAVVAIASLNATAWQIKRMATGRVEWLSLPCFRLALLVAFLAAGSLVTQFEIETPDVVMPLGAAVVCLSLLAHYSARQAAALDEFLLLAGASILWEVPWLALVTFPLYLGELLAVCMSPVAGVIPAPPVPVRIARYRSARFLTLLMVCILTAVAKELVTDVL